MLFDFEWVLVVEFAAMELEVHWGTKEFLLAKAVSIGVQVVGSLKLHSYSLLLIAQEQLVDQ